jgi:hypothetical protein
MPEDYFKEGLDAERKGSIASCSSCDSIALKDFSFIVKTYPSSILCPYAKEHAGRAYQRMGMSREAVDAYQWVLAAKIEKAAGKYTELHLQDGIKHSAAFGLCNIYERMKKYDSALYFLDLYDTVFLQGCCYDDIQGMEEDRKWTTVKYAEIFEEANRIRDAEHSLLSRHSFEAHAYPYEDHIVKKLRELFKKFEQPELLKSEIEIAVNNYFFDTVTYKRSKVTDTAIHICFNFLGAKVWYSYLGGFAREISSFDEHNIPEPWEKEKIIGALKQSNLYTMIQEL